jgi:hypothetical protein
MPSDQCSWLISIPADGDAEGMFPELQGKFEAQKALRLDNFSEFKIPELKVSRLAAVYMAQNGTSVADGNTRSLNHSF